MSITQQTSDVSSEVSRGDRDYDAFRAGLQSGFLANVAYGDNLFTTDASGLFDLYLDSVPAADRQYHNCNACRKFFETYGGLAVISDVGTTRPALWAGLESPTYYAKAVDALNERVRQAKVTGVFYSKSEVWGRPVTGNWTHAAVTPPASLVHKNPLLTPGQLAAEKKEDYRLLSEALVAFDVTVLDQTMRLLDADALYRGEKVIGPVRWLRDLHKKLAEVRGRKHTGDARRNLVWKAVADAPPGFCHVNTSMAGTLLADVAAGLPFDDAAAKFADKMHPLRYQRPQAAPTSGNIAQAEKVVETLGIARSLLRRFARLDEVEAIWRPAQSRTHEPKGGVFGHLTPKGEVKSHPMTIPAVTMTWDKFSKTVLPTAESIEFHVPYGNQNYTALTTAADPDAPPILQWDLPERRNPVAWYVWHGGSPPHQWGLKPGLFCKVNAVASNPVHWGDGAGKFTHHDEAVILILDGARDTRTAGAAIFPETLKSELHAVRSTIEAYSNAGKIEGVEESSACGITLSKGQTWEALVRVTTGGDVREYMLDRWD